MSQKGQGQKPIEQISMHKSIKLTKWLGEQLFLLNRESRARRRKVKRGQVYWCQFGENIGSEQCLKRPALILQNDSANHSSPNTVVAPITNTADPNSSVYPLNRSAGSPVQGHVLLGNIMTVSKVRLGDYICDLDKKTEMPGIEESMYNALGVIGKIKRERTKLRNTEEHLNRAKQERNEAQDTLKEIREFLNLPVGVSYAAILDEVEQLKKGVAENPDSGENR